MNNWSETYNTKIMKNFAKECKMVISPIISAIWSNEYFCYYDNDKYAIKQFALKAHHSWGTAYCDYRSDRYEIKEALSKIGATNISFKKLTSFILSINPYSTISLSNSSLGLYGGIVNSRSINMR